MQTITVGPWAGVDIDMLSTPVLVKSFRLIPILAAGQSPEEDYGALQVRTKKQDLTYPNGVTEDLRVLGPDVIYVEGPKQLTLRNAVLGRSYILEVSSNPDGHEGMAPGGQIWFGPMAPGRKPPHTASAITTLQATAALGPRPDPGTDGIDISGAAFVRVRMQAHSAPNTFVGGGILQAWIYTRSADGLTTLWNRVPQLDVPVNAGSVGAGATNRYFGAVIPVEGHNLYGSRLYLQPNGVVCTAGTDVDLYTETIY